jgi:regulator of protease activity HflC (stomatin/prohibitin superfamily)
VTRSDTSPATGALYLFVLLVGLVVLLVGGASGCKAWTRYQTRADANNNVKVSAIKIRNQAQRVKIAQQSARIKHERAIGQRLANQEIASRLTPLFVQYEMIEALRGIAQSGRNNSVVYIPAGANGVPLVSVSGQPQVFAGDTEASKK